MESTPPTVDNELAHGSVLQRGPPMTIGAVIEAWMVTVNLAQAKAKLSDLVKRAAAGELVTITRRGKPVALPSAVATQKKPLRSLAAFRATMPRRRKPSAILLREMRDEER
jgi:antitoxin (DNA-binding transcriptional repressor) of toxin-antitoxin stability system